MIFSGEFNLQGQISPLAERIVTIGPDRLLPNELTISEIRSLVTTLESFFPATEDWEKARREDWLEKLDQLDAEFVGKLIPLSRLEDELSFLLSGGVNIFDERDDIHLVLARATDEHAKKQLKFWQKRFAKAIGRAPTEEEIDLHLHPGYQLLVESSDEETKASLTSALEEKGFPVSRWRGLEQDEDLYKTDENQEEPKLSFGRPDGIFRKTFDKFYAELTPGVIGEMQLQGKIPAELAAKLIGDEKARQEYVWDLTLFALAEDMYKNLSSQFPENSLDFYKTYIKIELFKHRF